jgi:formylglycine-generating enzyme required for sulfatase activity
LVGVAVIVLLLGVLLGKGLGGGTGPTATPTVVTMLTRTATLTSLPAEPLLTQTATRTSAPAEPSVTETLSLPVSTAAPKPPGDIPMVLIPAGEFQMGSESGDSDEKPAHTVSLDDFFIDVYEVTNALYAECVAAGKCDPPTDAKSYTRSSYYGNPEYADYPVIYVDWNMAQAYCEWRGGSLPTEAQWEKAARGGREGKAYPWGDESPTCTPGARNGANYLSCSPGDTMAVGSFSPNGYGLYDMAGNVWEWVMDWYLETFYNVSPASNPTGPDSGTYRVLRGGGWVNYVRNLRSADRDRGDPANTNYRRGFRCARSSSPALSATLVPTLPATPAPLLPTDTPAPPAATSEPMPMGDIPMALIPAGEFQMGSDADEALAECQKFHPDCRRSRFEDEEPVHTVHLDDYYIDVYEVTNARYAECLAAGKCDPPLSNASNTRSSYYGNPEYADYPVIYVTWNMAQAYCEWRGGSLPTEAQWEKAARGGREGMAYPWGDEAPTCTPGAKNGANYSSCSPGDTMAVGRFSPNGYGLYDMAGNVQEWVMDWYLDTFYGISPSRNPTGPDTGQYRVLRAGSWFNLEDVLRAAFRVGNVPTVTFSDLGFRCSRSP